MKIWERLLNGDEFRLRKISVESSPIFVSQEIDFCQLTVLTGMHGTGKSHLEKLVVKILGGHFGQTDSITPPLLERTPIEDSEAAHGKYTVSYMNGDNPVQWNVAIVPGEMMSYSPIADMTRPFPEARFVDQSIAFGDYSRVLDGWHEPLYVGGWNELRKGELGTLKSILGHSYQRFAWRNLGFIYENLPVPDFEADNAGKTLTTRKMSSAELWVHYCLWRLRIAEPGTVVAIDEPENFLSPAGHGAFLEEIARITLANKIQTIVATHSAAMITRTPSQFLRVFLSSQEGIRLVTPSNSQMTLQLLGHEPGLVGIVFVEDKLARDIVISVLVRFDRELAHRVDVVDAGGKDRAITAGQILARSEKLRGCVVLDGDQRATRNDAHDVPVTYLPGSAPDDLLLDPVRERPELLADRIGANVDDVMLALDTTRFHAHQYWFNEIGRRLGVIESVVVTHLISIWLADEAAQADAQDLALGIRAAVLAEPHHSPDIARVELL